MVSSQTRYVYKTEENSKFTDMLCLQKKTYKHNQFTDTASVKIRVSKFT